MTYVYNYFTRDCCITILHLLHYRHTNTRERATYNDHTSRNSSSNTDSAISYTDNRHLVTVHIRSDTMSPSETYIHLHNRMTFVFNLDAARSVMTAVNNAFMSEEITVNERNDLIDTYNAKTYEA